VNQGYGLVERTGLAGWRDFGWEDWQMVISRILSLLVALVYVVIALIAGAGWETVKLAAFLLLPLACIWFSEENGRVRWRADAGRANDKNARNHCGRSRMAALVCSRSDDALRAIRNTGLKMAGRL